MKTKKVAHFDIGKILAVAEHSLLRLWIASEKKLDQWLEEPQKRKTKQKQELPKKSNKVLAEEREEAQAVRREIHQKKVQKRFTALEIQSIEIENENSIEITP
ncbi:hypothetical protein [Polaribacter cellanae]|uniref:Uncharacterized protein n=1 Tax=Polaribacter cellanae TaxID=2818493 RepID=A0A975H5Q5_9FLAO|nr:hypothetical protein [Polaribacter cellanae]QTE21119.1 hypothetical protein J3359_09675 [Polaribacter cellanae]